VPTATTRVVDVYHEPMVTLLLKAQVWLRTGWRSIYCIAWYSYPEHFCSSPSAVYFVHCCLLFVWCGTLSAVSFYLLHLAATFESRQSAPRCDIVEIYSYHRINEACTCWLAQVARCGRYHRLATFVGLSLKYFLL
jgi:hypothetical protein